MEKKLEITSKLEELGHSDSLDSIIAILNLPTANFCEKRGERVLTQDGSKQSCEGCITQGIKSPNRMAPLLIKKVIEFFAQNYGTRWITINGRGDPFHPELKSETIEKICYARRQWDIGSYVFTAGNNLDEATCRILAEHGVNVMISLFGNQFINADFFYGKKYFKREKPFQDEAEIAKNLRRLISTYKESSNQPKSGTTRIGMNYVVSPSDLDDKHQKLKELKAAANEQDLFFACNTPFSPHQEEAIQLELESLAREYSNFHQRHTTAVNDQCQMGAGSSATVDFDGTLLRCPYMDNQKQGDGKIHDLTESKLKKVLSFYMQDRSLPCVMRPHQK
jgi:sulfatase maturation enzyme AslB (radical SAM superfamily)